MMIPSVTACPERLVPPLRKVMLLPSLEAYLRSSEISSVLRGVATPLGISEKCDASDEMRYRSISRVEIKSARRSEVLVGLTTYGIST